MAPGPLLTFTIIKTVQTPRYGYMTGVWIIAGHALLESMLIIALLLGVSSLLNHPLVARIVGVSGSLFLVYMGINLLKDKRQNKTRSRHDEPESLFHPGENIQRASKRKSMTNLNPIIGGILISMSNPYWWIWWATFGFAFMHRYGISFEKWPALIAFLLGHEAGDLGWYWLISIIISAGKKIINNRIYNYILTSCGIVLIGFGIYLGISQFLPD